MASSGIRVHGPASNDSSLADGEGGFDRKWFMGRWGVAWSTLPLWKDKRDVVITYTPVAQESNITTTFDSSVTYHKKTASEGSSPSSVNGVETLTAGANGATFDWRGKGWMFFIGSHWQVLGYGLDQESKLEWAVTFFSRTLFTPAGIDIYIRNTASPPADPDTKRALVEKVRAAIEQVQDGGIDDLAKGGFEIPGVI